MSETKSLLNALLCDIYGKQEQQARRRCRHKDQDRQCHCKRSRKKGPLSRMASSLNGSKRAVRKLNVRQLIDVCAMLKVEILMMGYLLERVLIGRDRLRRHQDVLCEFVTAILIVESHDAQPKMRFSLSPPPPKVSLTSPNSSTTSTIVTTSNATSSSSNSGIGNNNNNDNNVNVNSSSCSKGLGRTRSNNNMQATANEAADDAASDYNQWLHAMKLVARLPGGTPPEFRRKLWLSLADKYLKSKNVDWAVQREKCFCEEWREDDEELGIQIVKDLHRTGSNLCTGPAGSINQAKLKRILLGYARYNPEVGYCQGFNMLGALILQVMDKEEEESMKVMIYLVEGVLPTGYFYGSMGGLQADMGVFRELMQTKLPRLAKHLQRLQGPVENAYEPPLTNVFTMQWFLTMFCTCLPMSCVLRVWDLVLIEGSDVLLRTALVLWSLLEERVLNAPTADEFYGKMGSFSNELLNGHLIDSNGLIEKVVQLGPIADIKQLRDKHLYNIAPLGNRQGLQLYYDDEETHSDEESRLAVATVWGLNWGRRGSMGTGAAAASKPQTEQKDRLALDISLLKKQYDRLRERQKQAHVILTTACSTATSARQASTGSLPVNQLLLGRPAIVTNRGKRIGAPLGAIPPARKPSLPAVLHSKPAKRQLRRGETLLWRDTDATRQRRDSLTWKEIKADRAAMLRDGIDSSTTKTQKLRSRLGKSDSSSYSEDSDGDQVADGKNASSTDTSLCDDDDPKSMEQSPKRKAKLARKLKEKPKLAAARETSLERRRPKSWAPSTHEIPFMLMGTDSGDEKETCLKEDEDSATECDRFGYARDQDWSQAAGDLASSSKVEPLHVDTGTMAITSISQLSPLPDIASYLSTTSISPLPTPKPVYVMSETEPFNADAVTSLELKEEIPSKRYDVSDNGVTNQYFERVNSVERPKKLELSYSFNADEAEEISAKEDLKVEPKVLPIQIKAEPTVELITVIPHIRDDNIPGENKDDYKELLNMTIKPAQPALPPPISNAMRKRQNPRRKTLTRSSTIELEERFQALERRLSEEQPNRQSDNMERITKHIPSTAALEERYNTLEKRRLEEVETETLSECFEKPERIPSTSDLEIRFNALAKQLSSNGTNSKPPIDLNDQEKPKSSSSKEENNSEKTSKLHKSDKADTEAKKPATKSEDSAKKEAEDEHEESEKPRLKKLPSTAELEDRFNALERKMSIQKSSSAKTKKEPPDEDSEITVKQAIAKEEEKPQKAETVTKANENQKTKAENSNDTQSTQKIEKDSSKEQKANVKEQSTSPTQESQKQVEPEEDPKSKPKESIKPAEETEQTSKDSAPSNTTEKNKEVETAKRKSPPSTEELEKRFNALEKQLSTTHIEIQKKAQPDNSSKPVKQNEEEPAAQKTVNVSKREVEVKTQKSIKSFDDKVKAISATLTVEEQKKEQMSEATVERRKGFEAKCKAANQHLVTKEKTQSERDKTPKAKPELAPDTKAEQTETAQATDQTKRRASEPPSMEDLEKRYDRLKRRMSSRNQLTNQNETVNEALERIEQEVIAELVDTTEEAKSVTKQPPSTEDLESRYDALHAKDKKDTESKSKIKTPPQHVDVAIEAHIPDAPPPPPAEYLAKMESTRPQQRALIEELQSKMQRLSPGEENLKPSEINPQRHRQPQQKPLQQRPTTMGDETSETHANTAYYRSRNYEPCQGQRMVRRFSDLPSRADLENRLQFLEKKLYKKFYKQRCASDSEVASRASSYDERPSTSHQAATHLEQRVQALEKQLSENSLKLLEAIRDKDKNVPPIGDDSYSPRRQSTDSNTGKELVRYTQNFGELEESGDRPFNISINIKMLVNKESEQKKAQSESTTDDLRRRLEQLEQQLIEERARNGTLILEAELLTEDIAQQHQQVEENEANRKQEKDTHNENVKCDETDKLEEVVPKAACAEPETVKETKTLENEEKAQIRNKEVETQKCLKDEGKLKDKAVEQKIESETSQPADPKTNDKAVHQAITEKKNDEESNDKAVQPETIEKARAPTSAEQKNPLNIQIENPVQGETIDKPVENAVDEVSQTKEKSTDRIESDNVIMSSDIGPVDPKNQTVVLLMDNEPKALKVRRLTRANTEELEDLFQALEKQLNDRNLVKSKDGKLVRVESKPSSEQIEQAQAISDLTKEIEDFTSTETAEKSKKPKEDKTNEDESNYDWGPNEVKHHLKRKTVYLPSTKELEARFRSLERQIKLLEDVENIDVEQRLNEIERKIKLQYSLSHEKDLNKYIELCEGKGLDDDEPIVETPAERSRSPARKEKVKSPYISPARKSATKSPYVSPSRTAKSPYTSPTRQATKTPRTSPNRSTTNKKSPHTSPAHRQAHRDDLPISDDLEYKYRVLDLVRSKSKDNLSKRKIDPNKKPPIHPLEMLLDPSPDSSEIPTTGELEHRIRLLDEKLKSPSRHKSRSRSPTIEDIKRKKMFNEKNNPKSPVHNLERMVYSPDKPEPPTAEELDERMRALEEEQSFDFKTQKDYKRFNQKLKDVISPSLSYEEFKAAKSREQSPRRSGQVATTPKSALRRDENDDYSDYRREETTHYRPTSPKVIRFRDEDDEDDYYEETWRPKRMVGNTFDVLKCLEENTKILKRMLKKTLADQPTVTSNRSYSSNAAAKSHSSESLEAMGSRLMRETSPITRTGTHTGVPLRTGENINDRLSSIKNSIKSIDSLCEEKPYQKEKCQRYIDSLFSDSLHFASKKSSAEDLTHSRSESRGRGTQRAADYTPAIRISSEHRSLGSVESLRTGSPLRASSPPHHRSHRDISRELSPHRRRREAEEHEERESSRVRRDNILPNYLADNRSELSSCSSLTKFHKVDRQLEETCAKYADDRRSACRSPLSSPYENRPTTTGTRYNTTTTKAIATTTSDSFPRPISPYRQPYDPNRAARSNTPVYQPAKLEIRHTTVTSTFYDRFLTEKQIEKQTLSRPPSRSPVVSPSATSKSYSDLPGTLTAHKPLLDVCTTSSYSPMSRSYTGSSSSNTNYSYLTNYTASEVPVTSTVAPVLSVSELGSRTSATILTTTGTTSSVNTYSSAFGQSNQATSTTTSAFVPYNFTSSFTSRFNESTTTSTTGISTLGTSSHTYSTGVYNPMMSFTLREPSIGNLSALGSGSSGSSLVSQYQFKGGFSYSPIPTRSDSEKP